MLIYEEWRNDTRTDAKWKQAPTIAHFGFALVYNKKRSGTDIQVDPFLSFRFPWSAHVRASLPDFQTKREDKRKRWSLPSLDVLRSSFTCFGS